MRAKRLDLGFSFPLAFLLVMAMARVGVAAPPGTRPPPGKPIEFWDPNQTEVTTNLNQANQILSRPSKLKQIEEDIFRPLENTLTPRDSLQGVPAVPYRPEPAVVIPSKRAQELLERQRNWIFMTPAEVLGASKAEETLKSSGLETEMVEKEKTSAMQRYYLSLSHQGNGVAGDQAFGDTTAKNSADPKPETRRYSPEVARREEDLRKLMSDSDAPVTSNSQRRPLSDIFGMGEPALTPEQVAQQKLRREEYRQLFSLPMPATSSLEPVNPLLGQGSEFSQTAPNRAPERPTHNVASGFGFPDPTRAPSLATALPKLPDVNSVLQSPGVTPQFKPPEPPVRTPPPSPTFLAPRRSF
jgi:hypothetical protein